MKWKLACEKCGDLDYVLLDGYAFGDRLLEGVKFRVSPGVTKNGLKVVIDPGSAAYFADLNQEKWLREARQYAKGMDFGECPKCGEDVDGPNLNAEEKSSGLVIPLVRLGDALSDLRKGSR